MNKVTQKKSFKILNVRSKLFNLSQKKKKIDEEEEMEHLEKSLQKENKVDDSDMEKHPQIPNDQMEIQIQNRLWHYFLRKIQPYEQKVEKEKVNCWGKLMQTIIKETDKKLSMNCTRRQQCEHCIKNKYKQTHELFLEIEKLKRQKKSEKQSRRKRENTDMRFEEKKKVIHENIESLNDEIEELTEQKMKVQYEIEKIKKEKQSFLRHLLREGYYRADGVSWILRKMKQINYRPIDEDFPLFLDSKSKQFLLKIYDDFADEKKQKAKKQKTENSQLKKRSTSEINLFTKGHHLKDIYKGTKQYLLDWVKKEGWKEEIKLPKIGRGKEIKEEKVELDWVELEKKRINHVYKDEMREKIKKIEFGIKLEN